jgi:hypothetical protein
MMIVAGLVGCADRGEETLEASAYAGCTVSAVVRSELLDEGAPEIPDELVTQEYDAWGGLIRWTETYDPTRPPMSEQLWERRPGGQETSWQRYRDGWLVGASTTTYGDDGLPRVQEYDEDGDGAANWRTEFFDAFGLTRTQVVHDASDDTVDSVYVLTYDDRGRLIGRSGRFDAADGPEFHQETWTWGEAGWLTYETTEFLSSWSRYTRDYDDRGRLVADTSEDVDSSGGTTYDYLDDDDRYDGGTTEGTYGGVTGTTTWTVTYDARGRTLEWRGESDDDGDGTVDYTTVETSTWDCPDR